MTDDPNRRIGDYEVLAVLGAGGMGKVFKVRNVISDRIEAMKILLPDLAGRQELADRFLREIKLLASLDHPNIAQLRTALRLSNRLVMVMEYVEGTTIADRLEQGPIPPEEAMGYVTQVLNALAYAHGRNVIHRDIKPANMMITPNGTVKLMDFGIARASSDQSMTVTGTTVGSLFYMSPEQVKGEGVDFRSDLYSLGVSLYEMVTGERPFKASSDYSLMTAQLQERPKPPSELRPGLPGQLNGIILHSMAKDPAERFQSADEFRQALEALRQTMPASAPVVAPPAAAAFTPVTPVQPLPVQPASVAAPTVAATAAFTPVPTAVGTAPNPPALPMPPTQPTPSVMQLSPPPSKGRGLYMALGAVIVLAVLVLAGISLPRMLKTRASEQKAADQNTSSTSNPSTSQTPNSTTTPPADASASANPSTGTSGTTSSDTGTNAQPPADSGTAASTSGTTTSSGEGSSAGTATTDASAGAGAPPTSKSKSKKGKSTSTTTTTAAGDQGSSMQGSSMQGSSMPGSPGQTTSGTDQGQVTADTAQKESVEEMEQDVDQTSSRAAAANSSLDTMTRQLRSQGLNLRGDIVAAQEAMKTNLDKANQALQRNDTKSARRYLNMAQANMEKIEKFLGH